MRILLACNAGMSTSMIVSKMEEIVQKMEKIILFGQLILNQ